MGLESRKFLINTVVHFKQAYMWDISANPFPIHQRLSQEHIYLSPEGEMKNHLAEEVLNGEMLHLMKQYRESLGDAGSEGTCHRI
jgi:hypothetical protein